MNVTVFGATGAIGSLTVDELLANGHNVTAYVRNPEKVPARWSDRVRVVVGEMSDSEAIDDAIKGASAVVSALGPSMDKKATGLPLVDGTRHILESMKRHGVSRIIGQSTPSVPDPWEKRTVHPRLVAFMGRTFLRRAYDEMIGMSTLITESRLDWTIVRFTAPNNKDKVGTVRAGFFGTDKIGFPATRADIAAFTAAQVDSAQYIDRAPAISN